MRRFAILAIAVVAGCGLPDGEYFGDVPSLEGRDLKHFRWCNSGEPESMDPAQASTTTSMKLIYAMFDGLAVYDPDGMPTPSLATRMDVSPDQRKFTFPMHDRGKWSNGRPITAYDFVYHGVRVLHPITASPNADGIKWIKNAEPYTGNRVRVLLRDAGGLPAGTIVDVTGVGGKPTAEIQKAKGTVPDTNHRKSTRTLALRDLGAPESAAYARVPPQTTVTVIEISGRPASMPSPSSDGTPWAYVFWPRGDGVYGWIPFAELDVEPNAATIYQVKPVSRSRIPGHDAPIDELIEDAKIERSAVDVAGRDMLMLPEVLGFRAPDALTFVAENEFPTPFFLNLSNNRVLRATPREAVSRNPKRWAEPGTIITSGPMHMTAWKERDYIELVRSPTYWNPAEVKTDKITAYAFDNQSTAANYYYTGGCDSVTANNIPSTYLPVMTGEKRNAPPFKDYIAEPYLGIYFAYVNTKKVNRHLRRALSYAIDRRPIPSLIKGGEQPSAQYSPGKAITKLTDEELALCGVTRDHPGVAQIVVAGELCYIPPPGLDFDPAKAKAELALARGENGVPSTITYRFNTGVESHKLIAEYMQQQWKTVLGLDVTLENQEWKVFVADTRQGNYELARFGLIGNFPDSEAEFLAVMTCESPDNRAQWCNQDFEAAMNAAKPIGDRKKRLEKIYEAERIMVEDAPVIPLYVYTQKLLARPYVKGLDVNFVDQPSIFKVWLDPDWRKHPVEARK
jgi:oligopeptide transport system substrate-binding protein